MPNLPDHVWILGKRFTIYEKHPDIKSFGMVHGCCDSPRCMIVVTTEDRDEQFCRETLLHEIVHAIDHAMTGGFHVLGENDDETERGIMVDYINKAIAHNRGWMPKDEKGPTPRYSVMREDVVSVWAVGLFQVLNDPRNAKVVRYIIGDAQLEFDYGRNGNGRESGQQIRQ